MEKNKRRLKLKDIIYIITTTLLVAGLATSIVFLTIRAQQHDDEESYYTQKIEMFSRENANFSHGQIVFIGDSITDLYHLDDYYADLDKAVYNRGIGGDTTQGVIDRLHVSLYEIKPTKVVLMIGINDINGFKSTDYIVDNYETILSKIQKNLPTTEVYTMSITPQNHVVETYANWINVVNSNNKAKTINVEIEKLATKYGYTYLDLYSKLVDSDDLLTASYTDDGIHLNHNGFTVWTNLVKPYLI